MGHNVFASLRGDKLLTFILEDHEEAIYYNIVADANPDLSDEDQTVLTLRYVSQSKENEQFEIKEEYDSCLGHSALYCR
jgi:hypothetical protein